MKDENIMSMKKIAVLLHGPFICRGNLLIIDGRKEVVHACTHKEGHMKHNRIIALVASALLAVGATAVVAPRAFAQAPSTPSAQVGVDTDREQFHSGDQNGWGDREVGDRHDPIPQGKPAITATAAIATAQAYLKTADVVGKLRLEDENGRLMYSVWFGATDVKVDAMTGKVLTMDSGSSF